MNMRIIILILSLCQPIVVQGVPEGYTQLQCSLKPIAERASHISHTHMPGPRVADKGAKNSQQTSLNWSGYVVANNLTNPAKNSVTAVYGSWVVPTISKASKNTYSAIWVGIDGYSNSTVEQIGTGHDWVNGVMQNYAWFEMYPGGSYSISGFPVNPGDVISTSVVYTGNNVFVMTIFNDSKKVSFTVPTSYTTSASAQRSSAEWIIEAPYLNGILPLSSFGTVYLWGGVADVNGIVSPINSTTWQNVSLEMVTNAGQPKSISSALLQDQGSFFTVWQHQ